MAGKKKIAVARTAVQTVAPPSITAGKCCGIAHTPEYAAVKLKRDLVCGLIGILHL